MRERCSGVCQAPAPWQEIEDGPEDGKVEGGANKHEQWGGKESGDGARGRGGRKPDSPTCRSVFQQRSWPWSLWAVRSRQSRTAWSPHESSPGCWRVWRLMAQHICKNREIQTAFSREPRSPCPAEWERSTDKQTKHLSVDAHVGKCENPSTSTKDHACIKTLTLTAGKYRASLNKIAPATLETASRYKGRLKTQFIHLNIENTSQAQTLNLFLWSPSKVVVR